MKHGKLMARVDRLVAIQKKGVGRFHRIVLDCDETEDEARAAYERDNGVVIRPEDSIVWRVIVAS